MAPLGRDPAELCNTPASGYPDDMARREDTKSSTPSQRRARRSREDVVDRLRSLAREERRLDAKRIAEVARARAAGESWSVIAEALGLTKQSAWEYYNDRLRVELSHRQNSAGLSQADAMRLAVSETKRSRRAKRR